MAIPVLADELLYILPSLIVSWLQELCAFGIAPSSLIIPLGAVRWFLVVSCERGGVGTTQHGLSFLRRSHLGCPDLTLMLSP